MGKKLREIAPTDNSYSIVNWSLIITFFFCFSFSNRDSIILHKKQHNQEKTHFCSICFKGFYKASCLTRHMRSHTGERPYICEFCYKSFSQSTTLRQHRDKCTRTPQAGQQQQFSNTTTILPNS